MNSKDRACEMGSMADRLMEGLEPWLACRFSGKERMRKLGLRECPAGARSQRVFLTH